MPGAADREHEGAPAWIGAVERALELVERRLGGPVSPKRTRGVAQPRDRAVIGLGHHPEQAGLVRLERVGDGEVGRQRQRRVASSDCRRGPEGSS